jgi:hypothetical protein
MFCRSRRDRARAVDPGYHQGVAFAQELEQRCQFFAPLRTCPGHLFGSDYGTAGSGEGIKLDGKVLIDG